MSIKFNLSISDRILNPNISTLPTKTIGTSRGNITTRMTFIEADLLQLLENFKTIGSVITYEYTMAVAQIAADLLANAQPRVPYFSPGESRLHPDWGDPSTGQLRESGRASLRLDTKAAWNIAKGKKDGTITTDLSKVSSAVVQARAAKSIYANIGYYRLVGSEGDIAVWTHESLGAYEERSGGSDIFRYYARGVHTGPKYLELAWIERQSIYYKVLRDAALDSSIRQIASMSITSSSNQKFMVDRVKLVRRKISKTGYFGGLMG